MSGTSYSRRNKPDPTAAIVGKLIVNTAAGLVGIAGLAAVGVAKGIGTVAKLGMDAYKQRQAEEQAVALQTERELQEMQQQKAMRADIQSTQRQYGITPSTAPSPQLQQTMDAYQRQAAEIVKGITAFQSAHIQAVQTMPIPKAQDADAFAKQAEAKRKQLEKEWAAKEEQLRQKLMLQRRQQAKLFQQQADTYHMMRQAAAQQADARQKAIQLRKSAEQLLQDAGYLLSHLVQHRGTQVFAADDLLLYRNIFTRIAAAYHEGADIAAVCSRAQDLCMQISETYLDVESLTAQSQLETDSLALQAAMLSESLAGAKDLRYELKGATYAIDLSAYAPEGFATAAHQLAEIFARLQSNTPMRVEERKQLAIRLRTLQVSCETLFREARTRMENSFASLDFARDVIRALASQNYVRTSSAFDASDQLQIQFENAAGCKLVATITTQNGQPALELKNYGADEHDTDADPAAQQALLRAIEEATHLEMCCHGLGKYAQGVPAKLAARTKYHMPIPKRLH